ncbi:MAG: iron-containing alcohol dehydrogenase [Rhodospirillaceae bacterium]|nr:iron-containing alcohol dehydrogenase [Rhodospirillaceae bacterium]
MTPETYFTRREGGEYAYTIEASKLKFGVGAIHEVGADAKALGMTRVALFTDQRVAKLEHVAHAARSLKGAGLGVEIYDSVEVEPTDRSFMAGAAFARDGKFDGFVSVGGGSVMDTAKAANLYASYPADLLTYVNKPVGEAQPVPGPLMPHIACPTTFGTASECTGMAIFDMLEMEMKTGIAHRELRPSLGILDPTALTTLPAPVVAANAFDVFSHAIESLTARPYTARPAPDAPAARPLLQGANPYSDMACSEAIRLIGANIEHALNAPDDISAREPLMFAGMLAGIGFGNSGCHVPHAMSYAVAGLVRDYRPEGWPDDHAMVPHGISVILNAPAVFRLIGPAAAARHLQAAQAMGADIRNIPEERAGEALAEQVIRLMRVTGMPNGLSEIGYSDADIEALTDRTLPQKRLLDIAPRDISRSDLQQLFKDSMRYW